MRAADDDLEELRLALRADAAGVAEALLGPPNKAASTKSQLRWGSKGGLALELAGPKKGVWIARDSGTGSDLLGLIRHVHGYSFPDAVRWARDWTGIQVDDDQPFTPRPRPAPQPDLEAEAEEAAALAGRIEWAQRIVRAGIPIPGTPGELYFKQARGIPVPAGGWPASVLWHPAYRAVLMVSTTPDGTVQAVQRIHITPEGQKVGAEELARRGLRSVKTTNGVLKGAAVRLPGEPSGPLLLAEGPETGLAAYASSGIETWVALGGIGNLVPPPGRRIVVCRDDDKKHDPGDKKHSSTVSGWRKAGLDVCVATPWRVRRQDKSDLADTIIMGGVVAVRARLDAALRKTGTVVKRVPLAEARALVAQAVGGFFDKVDGLSVARMEWDRQAAGRAEADDAVFPPSGAPSAGEDWAAVFDKAAPESEPVTFTQGVRVDVGVGKSHEARVQIARTLAAMRARGDKRIIVLAVPMHALGDEQAINFLNLPVVQQAGLRVAVWRGRTSPDPDHPDYTEPRLPREAKAKMCGDLDRVFDAQAVGLNAQTAVCKRRVPQSDGTRKTAFCPLFHSCSYQAQQKREADLWIMSHDMLFHEKPEAMGDVAALVVDEAAWRKGLVGAEGRHITLSLDALKAETTVYTRKALVDREATDRLRSLRVLLTEMLDAAPDGPISLDTLRRTLLTADSAAEAGPLEWRRMVDPLHPGQSKEERRLAMETAEGNKTVKRAVMAWNALRVMLSPGAPEKSGWLEVGSESTKDGPVRVVRLKGRNAIKDGWAAPTLLLDALLPINLVRPFWPYVELVADVRAVMPHQHIRQVTDRAYSKAMLEPLDIDRAKADPKEAQRHHNRLNDLRATLIREARRHAPGKVLFVLQQAVEAALHDLGPLPPNVETAHHNNIAGRDEWRDAAAVIVVGRTLPSPGAVERIAEAMTGTATVTPMKWYDRVDAEREMADGSSQPAEAEEHADPMVDAIRWQIAEGELVQIVGRGRGVNRAEADPLDVLILTDLPLPMPLAGVLGSAELQPGPADHMMAAGGVVFENPTDAALAYPSLWATRSAAKSAFQRGKLGAFPFYESNIGECTQLRRIDYRPVGQGRSSSVAGYDPALSPDPEAFLVAALGPLAWCRVEGLPPSPEPPPRPQAPPGDPVAPAADGLELAAEPNAAVPDGAEKGVPQTSRRREVVASDAPGAPPSAPSAGNVAAPRQFSVEGEDLPLVCDVPWLHPEIPAYAAPDGAAVVICPHCGEMHRHRGYGHRLAHCARPIGRGYVLMHAGPVPASLAAGQGLRPAVRAGP